MITALAAYPPTVLPTKTETSTSPIAMMARPPTMNATLPSFEGVTSRTLSDTRHPRKATVINCSCWTATGALFALSRPLLLVLCAHSFRIRAVGEFGRASSIA